MNSYFELAKVVFNNIMNLEILDMFLFGLSMYYFNINPLLISIYFYSLIKHPSQYHILFGFLLALNSVFGFKFLLYMNLMVYIYLFVLNFEYYSTWVKLFVSSLEFLFASKNILMEDNTEKYELVCELEYLFNKAISTYDNTTKCFVSTKNICNEYLDAFVDLEITRDIKKAYNYLRNVFSSYLVKICTLITKNIVAILKCESIPIVKKYYDMYNLVYNRNSIIDNIYLNSNNNQEKSGDLLINAQSLDELTEIVNALGTLHARSYDPETAIKDLEKIGNIETLKSTNCNSDFNHTDFDQFLHKINKPFIQDISNDNNNSDRSIDTKNIDFKKEVEKMIYNIPNKKIIIRHKNK